MSIAERRNALTSNARLGASKLVCGGNFRLIDTLNKSGVDFSSVERKLAGKITKAILAKAADREKAGTPDPTSYYEVGISDSIIDIKNGEPWVAELMFVEKDWVFRTNFGDNDPECSGIGKKAFQDIVNIVTSPFRRTTHRSWGPLRSSLMRDPSLSASARALLNDLRATQVLQEMFTESLAAEEGICSCAICQEPERFIPFFPRGEETSSFGHSWSMYFTLLNNLLAERHRSD